ncbi:sugar-transfer associated ATP-grasp domain-containing protein [Oceanobacillus oncorhynchi]|uniref:sugar-transfer associated ATP-grasp domain-containing protein n=1 Tax=Oceanobacillus oncorhynchi TaxID=545501 RepID=UPI0034D51FDF
MKYIITKVKKVNHHIDEYVGNNNIIKKIKIYIDLLYSIARYGMNLDEYFQYRFFGKRHFEKDKFFIYRKRMQIVKKYNDAQGMTIFDDKSLFNEKFKDYVKREWLDTKTSTFSDFEEFSNKCKKFIVKPAEGYYGLGVRIEEVYEGIDLKKLYSTLCEEDALLEEIIVQLDDISMFNPSSVNTLRVVSMNDGKNNIEITTANLRMGNGLDKCADNFHHDGIAALIDIETGLVYTRGIDKYLNYHIKHPISEKQIVGYKVPYWDEVKRTVKNASQVLSSVGYVGWDIAIGKDGDIIIIEGNPKADPDVSQLPDGIGKWEIYKKYLQ